MNKSIQWVAVIVPTILILVGALFDIISVASDNWNTVGSNFKSGLWRICDFDSAGTRCTEFNPDLDWFKAVRALSLLSLILLGVLSAPLISYAFISFAKGCYTIAVSISAAVSVGLFQAALLTFSLIIYASEFEELHVFEDQDSKLGWSYALGWVGAIFYMFSAAAFGIQSFVLYQASLEKE